MELVEAIFYKKINPGDLLNIDHALHAGGGGQTYLDLAGIDQNELCRFLEYGQVIERTNPPTGDHRRKFGIYAYAIGTNESKLIEFDPRNNRPNYKLSDQRSNRHPAWTPRFGFPASPEGARYARDVTNIPNLLVYIVRTSEHKYYAGFVNIPSIPNEWPNGVGLERLFSGERKGVYFVENGTVMFNNNATMPFSILTTEVIADIDTLPEDIATQTRDAVEYVDEEVVVATPATYTFTEQPAPVAAPTATTVNRSTTERRGRHIDFVRAQRNRTAIGKAGEKAAFEFEKQRLESLGRNDLASCVEWVSQTQGDGLGYDIHSFDVIAGVVYDRYIEVKTTTGGIDKPFDVSLNEVEFSVENPDSFVLFRIFEFSTRSNNIRFYKVLGSIRDNFQLEATNFLASKL